MFWEIFVWAFLVEHHFGFFGIVLANPENIPADRILVRLQAHWQASRRGLKTEHNGARAGLVYTLDQIMSLEMIQGTCMTCMKIHLLKSFFRKTFFWWPVFFPTIFSAESRGTSQCRNHSHCCGAGRCQGPKMCGRFLVLRVFSIGKNGGISVFCIFPCAFSSHFVLNKFEVKSLCFARDSDVMFSLRHSNFQSDSSIWLSMAVVCQCFSCVWGDGSHCRSWWSTHSHQTGTRPQMNCSHTF